MKKTIFVVDDNLTNLTMAARVLEEHYRVITLSSAKAMFGLLEKIVPDLILLDIQMPEVNGFEAMERLKASEKFSAIPVIFLTGLTETESEAHGISLGAVDFITKPFSQPVLLTRIKNHLQIDELIRERTADLLEKTEQLSKLKNSIVFMMADVVESRDANTGGHIERTSEYMRILLDAMLASGIYTDEIKNWDINMVVCSARLHDVGKIRIPDSILNKPGKLGDDEFQTMKTHSMEGGNIIDLMTLRTGDKEFLRSAKLSATCHHEKWDGSGYPGGLSGESIPLHGRIMAVVDVYDALTSERPYKKAFDPDKAMEIIEEGSGQHFDPVIVKSFLNEKSRLMAV